MSCVYQQVAPAYIIQQEQQHTSPGGPTATLGDRCCVLADPKLSSVSVAKLVNATVHTTGTGGQTTLDSFLAAAGLHIEVRTNSVHALRLILGQALLRV